MSSGLKKFLIALGLVIVLGVVGNATAQKPLEGRNNVVLPTQSQTEKQPISTPKTDIVTTITLAPTATPTLMPTPTPLPTKIYKAPTATPVQTTQTSGLSNDNTYTNSAGNQVHSPAYSNSVPAGATAICGDGTYSFSQSRRGTCSHHGGVSQWL